MTVIRVGCIVEGRGDDIAVPILVHRVARIELPSATVVAETVRRVDRGLMVQERILTAHVDLVARELIGRRGILIVLDADDDCPATLGPQLQNRAQSARTDVPVGLVLAMREFEAWFIAAAESLRGRCNLPDSLEPHPRPESVRDAKGWLTGQMPRPRSYNAPVDQPALARIFDLEMARNRSDSFDKCYREITRLLHALA